MKYGIFRENADGTVQWLTDETPTTWGAETDALTFSYAEAAAIATYLTATGEGECRVGRPKTVPNH